MELTSNEKLEMIEKIISASKPDAKEGYYEALNNAVYAVLQIPTKEEPITEFDEEAFATDNEILEMYKEASVAVDKETLKTYKENKNKKPDLKVIETEHKEWLIPNSDGTFIFPAGDKNLKTIGKIVRRYKQFAEGDYKFVGKFSEFMDKDFEEIRTPGEFGEGAYKLLHSKEYTQMLCYWCLHANEYLCINEERNNEGKRRKFTMREQLKLI